MLFTHIPHSSSAASGAQTSALPVVVPGASVVVPGVSVVVPGVLVVLAVAGPSVVSAEGSVADALVPALVLVLVEVFVVV